MLLQQVHCTSAFGLTADALACIELARSIHQGLLLWWQLQIAMTVALTAVVNDVVGTHPEQPA